MQNAQVEITFKEALRRYTLRYAQFSGRATRAEYWYVALFNFYVSYFLTFCAAFSITSVVLLGHDKQHPVAAGVLALVVVLSITIEVVYGLGTFCCNLSLSVRRLHDSGHSGWWLLPSAVFLGFPAIVFIFFDSQRGRNEYGDSEKYPEAEESRAVVAGTPPNPAPMRQTGPSVATRSATATPSRAAPVRQPGTSKPAGTQHPAKCMFCGGDLRGATSFCPHCGAKVLK